MKFLKRTVSARVSVKDLLLKSVGGTEPARDDYLPHASDLTRQDPSFCPREFWLHRTLGLKRPDIYVQHAMRVTWDEGNDKQWRLNNEYLRPVMWGHWKCVRCDALELWQKAPSDDNCKSGKHRWEYKEPVFEHPAGFTGSLDGVVQFSATRRRLLEVKIMKADDFRELVAPLAEHRVRTQLYLRMVAESSTKPPVSIDTDVGHIIYIMRGHGIKQSTGGVSPFKEYFVERNDEASLKYVRMAQAISTGIPEGVCTNALCLRAKSCPVVKQCFGSKYPANQFWRKSP